MNKNESRQKNFKHSLSQQKIKSTKINIAKLNDYLITIFLKLRMHIYGYYIKLHKITNNNLLNRHAEYTY